MSGPFCKRPGDWEDNGVLRKLVQSTSSHTTATCKGAHALTHTFTATLKQHTIAVPTAPLEIRMLIELHSFPVTVKTMEREGCQEDKE
jgi:hypothetical protein